MAQAASTMNNLALIRIPSVVFPVENFHGHTMHPCLDEFTDTVSARLRNRLIVADVECGPVNRSHKPYGSHFLASTPFSGFRVIVCIEPEALPVAEITIHADSMKPVFIAGKALIWWDKRKRVVRGWSWFEPLFRRAVESEFSEQIKWMTIDEYIESFPPAGPTTATP